MSDKDDKPVNDSTEGQLDDAFKEAEFEDKIWYLWKNYQNHLFIIIAAIFMAFLGANALSFYKARQIEKLQDELRDAEENNRTLDFANRNPKEPLAGTIFLQAADKFFAEENYDEAIEYYTKALSPLSKTPLSTRSRMGIATANILTGNVDKGSSQLEKIMNDKQALGAFRAEAAYNLALIAYKNGNFNRAKDVISAVPNIPDAGIWATKAVLLKRTSPELAD